MFGRKLLFGATTVTMFFVLLEGLLALCGVSPLADREDPYVGFAGYSPLFIERTAADGTMDLVTADRKLTWFNRQQFPQVKAPGTVRIFCLGGSTTYGHPYNDATSFCGWLREFLPVADPARKWEVINAGGISYASYRVARLMEELAEYEPDVFIIYTGHNEFLERRTYGRLVETPDSVRGLAGLLARTRTLAAVKLAVDSIPRAQKPEPVESESFTLPAEVRTRLDSSVGLEAYSRNDVLTQQVTAHFRQNLQRIVRLGRSSGARVIFVTPASNLADCAPFKSEHRDGISATDAQRCDNLLEAARTQLTEGNPIAASSLVEQALGIDDRVADAHYLRGRCCLALQKHDDARAAFVRARGEDVCPLRAISEFRTALLDVAREENVPIVDFERMIDGLSPHGIPGAEWFLDHVHPTIEGNRRLALALIDTMQAQKLMTPGPGWNVDAISVVSARVEGSIDRADQARALVNLSKVLGWAGRREEADRLALQAVELLPDDAEAVYQAGNAYYEDGLLPEAERAFRRVLKLNPEFAGAWYGLGLVESDQSQVESACEHFRAAVALAPDFVDARYNLGNALMALGDLPAAAEQFHDAFRLQPDNRFACNNLGVIAANQRNSREAERWFKQALAIDATFADAHVNLGRVYHERRDFEGAAVQYEAALQAQPDHPEAVRLRARLERDRVGSR